MRSIKIFADDPCTLHLDYHTEKSNFREVFVSFTREDRSNDVYIDDSAFLVKRQRQPGDVNGGNTFAVLGGGIWEGRSALHFTVSRPTGVTV